MKRFFGLTLLISLYVAACGGGGDDPCSAGETVACICDAGSAGTQTCNAEGTGFETDCACAGQPDGGRTDTPALPDATQSDESTTDPGTDAGQDLPPDPGTPDDGGVDQPAQDPGPVDPRRHHRESRDRVEDPVLRRFPDPWSTHHSVSHRVGRGCPCVRRPAARRTRSLSRSRFLRRCMSEFPPNQRRRYTRPFPPQSRGHRHLRHTLRRTMRSIGSTQRNASFSTPI